MVVETLRKDSSKPLAVEVIGRDPTSPEQGRIWFNTSAGLLKVRIGSQNKVLAYTSAVWENLGGEGVSTPISGAVTYDIVGGLKPPADATRNNFHFGADPPTTGMKKGDFWIKNTGEPPFEIYQYDGVAWRKSVYSDFGEMFGHVAANQLNVFDWFLTDPNWQNDTPSADYVTWDECILTFDGESHVIPTGNTNLKYIWWDEDNPEEFQLTNDKPTLMAEDALMCVNDEGTASPILQGTIIHGGSITAHSITSEEIKAGTIGTEILNVVDWFPSEDLVWSDDTPSAGYITWSAFQLTYKGDLYDIVTGNTNKKYIWWDYTTPTVLQTTDTQPALDDNDCVVCVNESGTAHQILQATIIHGGAILTSSIEAAQIKAGTITASEITLVSIDSNGKLKLGEIGSGDIDDILDGTTYARVKGTALTSGEVDLSLAGVVNRTATNIAETASKKWAAETGADITSDHTSSDTSNVSGVSATTVKNNAADGKTAYDGTVKYRSAGAPTNNPTPSGIDKEMTDNATMNIKLSWGTYTQGAKQSDILLLFWKKGTSPLGAPTVDDSCIGFNVNTSNPSYFIFEGINPDDNLSFGMAAARRTESGLEIGAIQSPTSTPDWQDVTIGTPDYTAQIDGTAASTIKSNAADGLTAFSGTAKYRTAGAPTNTPTPSGVDKEINTNGTMNIKLSWSGYTQGANQADLILLFWKKGTSPLGAPSVVDSCIAFNVNSSASYHILEGVNPASNWTFGIAAARRTESGLEIGAIQSPTSTPDWQDVTEGTPDYTADVDGQAASTLKSNATDGKSAFDGTVKYRSAGAPTNNPSPTSIDIDSTPEAGNIDIKLSWGTYTQGANQADMILLFWKKGASSGLGAPTVNDSCVAFNVNTSASSFYIFEGLAAEKYYSFGVAAARKTESGLEIGAIQSPTSAPDWQDVTHGTPDYKGDIDGVAASTVTSNAANGATAFTGTVNYRSTGAPTNNPTTGNVTKTIHADGSMEIEIAWAAYTQGAKQADSLILFWKNGASSGLGAPTVNDSAVSFNVNTGAASYFVFESAATNRYYSFGIASARRTENGLEIGTIQSPGGWQDVTEGTANYTANISGTVAATVESNASQGATAYSGTTKYRSTGAPTNNPSPTAIDVDATPKAGNIDIKLSWGAYTQGAKQADVLLLFWKKGATSGLGAPTVNDSCLAFNVNTASASFYIHEGLASEKYYSFGIASARRTESGLEIGAIQSPTTAPDWQDVTSGTPDYKGNVDGETAANIHDWSEDPASRINVKATLIEPGKILIFGGTDLSDWRASGDYTYIDGGRLYAGSVTTNQIKLSSLTSDPSYSLCKIWYRSDIDQLRVWGTSTTIPFKIPRIPVASSVYITPLGVISSGQTSLTTFTNRTADNISETGTKKWAGETGADITGSNTAANASAYTGASIGTTYTDAKATDPNADQTSANTAANAAAYTGSSIGTTYTDAKATDPNADQTSANTANNASNYTGNTIGTSYTAAKATDPNADQTSTNTANNASNYTGNTISTPYTQAKATDPNADQTSAHDCQNPGDYTSVTAQAHSWLTNSPSTAHHPDYVAGGYTFYGGSIVFDYNYGPYTRDTIIEVRCNASRNTAGNWYCLMYAFINSTTATIWGIEIDEEQYTFSAGTMTFLVPKGSTWKVTVASIGASYYVAYYSRQEMDTSD